MIDRIQQVNRPYQEIGQQLIERINQGQFRIGERLPAERIIAEEMNVSRAVIREALIMLELLGLVEVRKGSGIYIIALPKQLNAKQSKQKKEEKDDVGPFEMLQARQVVESRIAELAAAQVTKNDILKLREALNMERKELLGESAEYDGDKMFHQIIADATQNSVLSEIVTDMWERRQKSSMWKRLHERIIDKNYREQWLEDHEKVFMCLRRKDSKGAGQAMWQHLENVKSTLMELSDVDDPDFDGYLFDTHSLSNSE